MITIVKHYPSKLPGFSITKIFFENFREYFVGQVHVFSFNCFNMQLLAFIQGPQPQPVLFIYRSILQPCDFARRCVDLLKESSLFRHNSRIICKHIQGETFQLFDIPLVRGVLHLPLVVDIRQEIAVLEVGLQIFWVTKILRRY